MCLTGLLRFKSAFFCFVLTATAQGDWTIVSSESEPGRSGVVHRHVVLENSTSSGRIAAELAIFSTRSCTLRLLQNRAATDGLDGIMRDENCLAGVNGGYFDEDFAPIGLRIANGQIIAPLKRAGLITGVLVASSRGVQIMRSREFSPRAGVTTAIQCGPFLVDLTRPIGGLNDSNLARRTFAATTTSNRALLGVCSHVSLGELSKILVTTSFAGDLTIERALNLDGGSSSGFWFARENGGAFSIREQKPVRDFVGVVPR